MITTRRWRVIKPPCCPNEIGRGCENKPLSFGQQSRCARTSVLVVHCKNTETIWSFLLSSCTSGPAGSHEALPALILHSIIHSIPLMTRPDRARYCLRGGRIWWQNWFSHNKLDLIGGGTDNKWVLAGPDRRVISSIECTLISILGEDNTYIDI